MKDVSHDFLDAKHAKHNKRRKIVQREIKRVHVRNLRRSHREAIARELRDAEA